MSFTPTDQQAILDLVAPLLESTLTQSVQQAMAATGVPVWRPGTCTAIEVSVAQVVIDGDANAIAVGIIGTRPEAGDRVMVIFVPPAAVFGLLMTPRGALGRIDYKTKTSAQGSITTVTDVSSLTSTITYDGTRNVTLYAEGYFYSSVANDIASLQITDASNNVLQSAQVYCPNTSLGIKTSCSVDVAPASGDVTYKVRAARANGTGNVTFDAGSTFPGILRITDAGQV